jgi:hypothetical protein
MSINIHDGKDSCRRLYGRMVDIIKGQLISRVPEILILLSFISIFGNFRHCTEMFTATARESYCKSHEWYFDSVLLKAELSDVYSSEEILRSNILDLNYFFASNLSTALREVMRYLTYFCFCNNSSAYFTVVNALNYAMAQWLNCLSSGALIEAIN